MGGGVGMGCDVVGWCGRVGWTSGVGGVGSIPPSSFWCPSSGPPGWADLVEVSLSTWIPTFSYFWGGGSLTFDSLFFDSLSDYATFDSFDSFDSFWGHSSGPRAGLT